MIPSGLAAQSETNPALGSTRVFVLAQNGGHHAPFVAAARQWLQRFAASNQFTLEFFENTQAIDSNSLARCQVFLQLDYPPYGWTPAAASAFVDYIEKGQGGWIGFHHATLLGEFDGYPMWTWFSDFMGGIRYQNYIAKFVSGEVQLEALQHPCLRGVPPQFKIEREEWYTYSRSPRDKVRVLAIVNEASYSPYSDIKMGDHPVIWSNERLAARNLYIFMGHGPELFQNPAYVRLVSNSLLWAAKRPVDAVIIPPAPPALEKR